MNGEVPMLTTNFAVQKTDDPENPYRVRKLAPRLGAQKSRRVDAEYSGEKQHREINAKISQQEMQKPLALFCADAAKTGIELGSNDSAIRFLRLETLGFGPSRREPNMHPTEAHMYLDDGQGNSMNFRLIHTREYTDEEGRVWDGRVIVFVDRAVIDAQEIKITSEMRKRGFTFLAKGIPGILEQAIDGQQPALTVRQESPCAICFEDGHHTTIGQHQLGCYCKEEREASLAIINKRGGINCRIPGIGNGHGYESQEKQNAARYSLAHHDDSLDKLPSYPETYNRMGKVGDDRNDALKISTLLCEHLFQTRKIPNITALTESRTKQNVWHEFGGIHTVVGESLNVTPPDHPDSKYKQQQFGYTRADQVPFPLQPRQ